MVAVTLNGTDGEVLIYTPTGDLIFVETVSPERNRRAPTDTVRARIFEDIMSRAGRPPGSSR